MSAEFETRSPFITEEEGTRLLRTINRVARGARRYRVFDREDFVAEVRGRTAVKVLRRAAVAEVRSLDALATVAAGTIGNDLWRSWCRRRRESSLDDGEISVPEPRDGARTPEEALLASERLETLRTAMRRLSTEHPRDGRMVRMSIEEGLSATEIAASEGTSRGYVHQVTKRARARLRGYVEEMQRARGSPARRICDRQEMRLARRIIHEGSHSTVRSGYMRHSAGPRCFPRRMHRGRGGSRAGALVV